MLAKVYVPANTRSGEHTPWNQGWMDYEIRNTLRSTDQGICYSKDDNGEMDRPRVSLIPRGRGPLDRLEGFELRDTEIQIQNNAIRVLAYTGHKWIVDPDPIKVQPDWHICTHENT